jgi:MFS family permease
MKELSFLGFIGICFVYFIQTGSGLLSPALQGIADGLGMDVNTVGLIQTIPGIFGVISSILVGKFVGTKIKYKTAVIGILVLVLIAALPLVITSWPFLLFTRVIVGLATGVYYALPPILLMKFFSGDQLKSRLGTANAFNAAGNGIMTLISGFLVVINWKLPFLLYLLPLIPLILLLIGMPEPALVVKTQSNSRTGGSTKLGLPIILNCITMAFVFCLATVTYQSLSVIVIKRGLGTGAQAGLTSSITTIGAVIFSALFAFLYKRLKQFLAPLIMIIMATGLLLLYFASSLVMVGVAIFLMRTTPVMVPTLITDNNRFTTPENASFATALLMAMMNIGVFFTGPFMIITSKIPGFDVPGPFFASIILAVLAVVTFLIRCFQKEPNNSAA